MKINVTKDKKYLKVYINNTIHIYLKGVTGFQSWIKGSKYFIEFYSKSKSTYSEYNNIRLWKEILKQLNNINL